ncbi:MAG: DMT family transporter [Pseudomonadota bacterium]
MTTDGPSIDRATLNGILAMIAALFGFVVNDAFVKFLSEEMPLGEIIFIRGVVSAFAIGALIAVRGDWPGRRLATDRFVFLRNVGEIGATVFYLTALTQLPLANAVSILQAMPFAITAVAALLLGEQVGWRRWSAILVGFFGVLLIVRPGAEGFNAYTIFAVIAVGFLTLRDMATRYVDPGVSTLAITFSTTILVTAVGAIMGLTETWIVPDLRQFALIAAASVFLLIGYVFVILAMRQGEVSVIAPFRYTIVLWALVIDFLVWSKIPSWLTFAGIAIVVGSGLYIFFRERRVAGGPPPD